MRQNTGVRRGQDRDPAEPGRSGSDRRSRQSARIRLRPPKSRRQRDERVAWSSGFKLLLHYARGTRKARNRGTFGGKGRRCGVRVTYLNNKTRGDGRHTGDTLAREGATKQTEAHESFPGPDFIRRGSADHRTRRR